MSTPLFLLLGLTIATCVIAYWAENLGKKLGKKRVTLLGLRPRQTATLMTMISSVAIMLFTFVVLLVVNSSLRGALLRYDEEKAANLRLLQDNRKLLDEQTKLKTQSEQFSAAADQARQEAGAARNLATRAHDDLEDARTDLQRERASLKTARTQRSEAQHAAREARHRAEHARRRAEFAGRLLDEAKQQLQRVKRDLQQAGERLARLRKDLHLAQAATREAQASAKQAVAEKIRTRQTLDEETRKFLTETEKQEEKVAQLQRLEATLNQEISHLEVVKNQLATLQTDVPAGTVFAARTVAPRTGVTEAMTQLQALAAEGARAVAENNSKRTLRLALASGATNLSPEAIMGHLAEYLATFRVPVSVRLVAARNHAEAETEIQAVLWPVPARQVFARGETIASMTISGAQSDARIFNQLLQLLRRAEDLARDRGVAPLLAATENFYSADTNERVFEALRRIQTAGGLATVRLIADADINTIDQLRVRFEISPAES